MILIISLQVYLFLHYSLFTIVERYIEYLCIFPPLFLYHEFDSLYSHDFLFFIFRLEGFWSGTSVGGARAWSY